MKCPATSFIMVSILFISHHPKHNREGWNGYKYLGVCLVFSTQWKGTHTRSCEVKNERGIPSRAYSSQPAFSRLVYDDDSIKLDFGCNRTASGRQKSILRFIPITKRKQENSRSILHQTATTNLPSLSPPVLPPPPRSPPFASLCRPMIEEHH